jgi:hypothetical protein
LAWEKKARPSFLKKRSKKLLSVSASVFPDRLSSNEQKFFGSFFQKRTASLRLIIVGTLRLGVADAFIPHQLSRLLARFTRAYPGIQRELKTGMNEHRPRSADRRPADPPCPTAGTAARIAKTRCGLCADPACAPADWAHGYRHGVAA